MSVRSSIQILKQSQDSFIQSAKKNQVLVEEIRGYEKELLKRVRKWIQNIAVAAHTGISVSEYLQSYSSKLEKSDVSNIQRVCTSLSQCGDIILNYVKIMDQLQMDLDKYLCESLRSLVEGELAIVANGPKLDSIRSNSTSINPKLSQTIANVQMAIDKFEIESLNEFTGVHSSFTTFVNGFDTLEKTKPFVEVAIKQKESMEKAYEESIKVDSASYRNYFGIPLKKLLDDEGRNFSQIPLGLDKALKYLMANGLEKEGLFRISSTPDKINFGKVRFLASNYRNEDPYLVANLVKTFIKEIPGCLIPKNAIPLVQKWDNELVAGYDSEKQELDENVVKTVAQKIHSDLPLALPPEHYTCLKYIVSFFTHLIKNEKSKMNSEAISTCISPNLFYTDKKMEGPTLLNFNKLTNRMFTFILDHVNVIFPSAKRCFNGRKKSVFMQNPEEIELMESIGEKSERSSPRLIQVDSLNQINTTVSRKTPSPEMSKSPRESARLSVK